MLSLGDYAKLYNINYWTVLELYETNNKNLVKTIIDIARIRYYLNIEKEIAYEKFQKDIQTIGKFADILLSAGSGYYGRS